MQCKGLVALVLVGTLNVAVAQQHRCEDSVRADTPSTDFTVNADGTVLHKPTGLVWKRCAEGQTGSNCAGDASRFNWEQALAVAEQAVFAGRTDWRLPNIQELKTLVERRCYSPAVNVELFPSVPVGKRFWSSSPYANAGNSAWSVHFLDGGDSFDGKGSAWFVRLVRAGQ